jgi:hypothetical protein
VGRAGRYLQRHEAEVHSAQNQTEGDLSLRKAILGSACALALAGFAASPALAGSMTGFDGLLGVDYSHLSVNHDGGDANLYGVSGTGTFGLAPEFAAQIDGGYHRVDVNHGDSANDWNVDGSAFWRASMGRLGAVVGYDSTNGDGDDEHTTRYGGFGEWYGSNWFTLGLKGGGTSGSHDSDGDYLGAAATAYATPDLAFTAGYDYTHIQHAGNENDWSIKGEWLFSERMPISVYADYTNSKISHDGPTTNIFSVGLTYYVDGDEAPLVERQRTGSEQWGTSFGPNGLKF